jgi:hypothetical protein
MCDEKQLTLISLLNHYMNFHKINDIDRLKVLVGDDIRQCHICQRIFYGPKGLSFHIHKTHKISIEEYYNRYLKIDNTEGICSECDNLTPFVSMSFGYNKCCSLSCAMSSSEVQDKLKKSCMDHYGVDNPMKSKEVIDKISKTFQDRYDVDFYVQSEEFKEKYKTACMDHFGVDHSSKSLEVKNKIKKTNYIKYGYEHTFQVPFIKQKIENTMLRLHGVINPFNMINFSDKSKKHVRESIMLITLVKSHMSELRAESLQLNASNHKN